MKSTHQSVEGVPNNSGHIHSDYVPSNRDLLWWALRRGLKDTLSFDHNKWKVVVGVVDV